MYHSPLTNFVYTIPPLRKRVWSEFGYWGTTSVTDACNDHRTR
jgi:hypothetical protein